MTDTHIHLERGEYTLEWLNQFIGAAVDRNIDEICLLEHSHRFIEFERIYNSIAAYSSYQKDWLARHMDSRLKSYQNFILQMRSHTFPVKVRFGLEVCYIEGTEDTVARVRNGFDWDFITGSVHWIDGFGFDHKPEFWVGKDVDRLYLRYYAIMKNLIRSNLFDTLAHPDSIKCFGHRPTIDLRQDYMEIACLLEKYSMRAEMSAGLHNNYGCGALGMNHEMLTALHNAGVKIVTASDAHRPEDVGKGVAEMEAILNTSE